MCRRWNPSQPAALVVHHGLPDLFLRVHDEGSVAGDRLVDRLPVHDEHRRVRRRLDRGLAALALEYDELAFVRGLAVHRETLPFSTKSAAVQPSRRSRRTRCRAWRRRSNRLIGVNVRAGPFAPSNSPAITLTEPASPGSLAAGMSRSRSSW